MLKKFYPGIVVLLGILIGSLITVIALKSVVKPSLEIGAPIGVLAATSAGNDNFSVATGQIDENVEGLFILDGLTGDLTCHVISTFSGQFFARMQHNVLNDLNLDDEKNPQLLLVTGLWNYRNQTGQLRPSNSIVYVVDSTSGNFAAYAVPWSKTISNKGRQGKHMSGFKKLGAGEARISPIQP